LKKDHHYFDLSVLLKRIADNDEKSFRILFDRYYGRLYDVALYFTKEAFAAQEVVSSVFIKIWINRSNHYNSQSFSSYLFIATKRQSLNYLRNNKKHKHQSMDASRSDCFVEASRPDDGLISDDFVRAMNAAIEKLPFKCRLVYQLVKQEDMKYREVAEMLEISVKAVEMHIGKALKRIRQELRSFQPARSHIHPN
jgi:RNA polymerase sigma-70 factor (ECF subfamily)